MNQMKNHCEMMRVSRIAWIETIKDRTAQIEKKAKNTGSELRIKIKETEFEKGDCKLRLHSVCERSAAFELRKLFWYFYMDWSLN